MSGVCHCASAGCSLLERGSASDSHLKALVHHFISNIESEYNMSDSEKQSTETLLDKARYGYDDETPYTNTRSSATRNRFLVPLLLVACGFSIFVNVFMIASYGLRHSSHETPAAAPYPPRLYSEDAPHEVSTDATTDYNQHPHKTPFLTNSPNSRVESMAEKRHTKALRRL